MLTGNPVYACAVCLEFFSEIDTATLRIRLTGVCSACYERMYRDTSVCFGKAYDGRSVDCRLRCPDRSVCRGYGQEMKVTANAEIRAALLQELDEARKAKAKLKRVERGNPFRKGTIRRGIFELARRGTTPDIIRKFCQDVGADPEFQLRALRRGFDNKYAWTVIENHKTGTIKVKA